MMNMGVTVYDCECGVRVRTDVGHSCELKTLKALENSSLATIAKSLERLADCAEIQMLSQIAPSSRNLSAKELLAVFRPESSK